MLILRNIVYGILLIGFLATLTGCPGKTETAAVPSAVSTPAPSPAISNLSPSVTSVGISNNSIVISGTNLNLIKALTISNSNGSSSTNLTFYQQSSSQIQATATSAMSLMIGAAYNLLVSTANAQTVIPIAMQAANNSLSPSVLTSGGATAGQVLQWNGSAWSPITPAVTATSGSCSVTWAGVTPASYTRTIPTGAHGKSFCDAAFSGSHMCTMHEVQLLDENGQTWSDGAFYVYGPWFSTPSNPGMQGTIFIVTGTDRTLGTVTTSTLSYPVGCCL